MYVLSDTDYVRGKIDGQSLGEFFSGPNDNLNGTITKNSVTVAVLFEICFVYIYVWEVWRLKEFI